MLFSNAFFRHTLITSLIDLIRQKPPIRLHTCRFVMHSTSVNAVLQQFNHEQLGYAPKIQFYLNLIKNLEFYIIRYCILAFYLPVFRSYNMLTKILIIFLPFL